MTQDQSIPYGCCQCGCGEKTTIAKEANKRLGVAAGEPMRYIHNHHTRKGLHRYERRDMGYDTPCWIWTGFLDEDGYGHLRDYETGKTVSAHRFHFLKSGREIPDGLHLDHLCRNRACCNPAHLEPVTLRENSYRGKQTKITDDQVVEIIASPLTSYELGPIYGVNPSTIRGIWGGRRGPRRARAIGT